jgi:acyl-CoA synthetase (AMP-forming)/AMP-acid ligase II
VRDEFEDGLPRAPAERAARYRADGLWDTRVLADGIEAAAARCPDAVALADNAGQLSYAELARAVASAVAVLAGLGVRPGQAVVLVSGNIRPGVIAYHALLRSGATVIALDRRCGPADLRAALDVGPQRPSVIISAPEATRLTAVLDGSVIIPLELFDGAGQPVAGPAQPEPDRDRAAVILFSSGTTGRPKGVLHSVNTLTAGAANMARITSADQDTVCFLISPLTSIAGLMQVHLTADSHATLVLEDQFDPQETLRRMSAAGASLLGGAPVIAERLLRAARPGDGPGTSLSLRTLALGGAMLPRPLLELAMDAFGIGIARVYGSSEAPNFSGSLPADDREARLSDDGALMPGSEVRVGSREHPREGLLRGPGVFLGYLDAGDNAGAFEGDWYRSGDQVELSSAGSGPGRLTVVGRLKEVVSRNGLKISLPEADAALAGLPGAVESSSFGMPDPQTGERLVVAVQPADGVVLTLDDVVAHLLGAGVARRKLPEQLVRWDGPLPRTASGKVVRSRLAMESPAKDSDLAPRLRDTAVIPPPGEAS